MKERLQKILNQSGTASRREAEKLIRAGQVSLNGKIAKLGDKADAAVDRITVRGKEIKLSIEKIYLALNKPVGYVTTREDELGRPTVYDLLPRELKKTLWPVGRLDFNTSGLLVLTNDGELTQKLTHPSFELSKEYEAVLHRRPATLQIEKLKKGVNVGGRKVELEKLSVEGSKVVLSLHEGRNRIVRRLLASVGLEILQLKRVRIGKLKLPDSLRMGEYIQIAAKDLL